MFPIKECEILIDFNVSMRSDQKFVDNLLSKFKKIKGSDESKTARKLLKELCDFRCLKDFTWQGTKKMKSFQDLHVVVELLTKVIKENYPESEAIDVLAKVVKQRTKSAKDAFVKFVEGSASASTGQIQDSLKLLMLIRRVLNVGLKFQLKIRLKFQLMSTMKT